jgi:8-oxo-dGTP pyrophosphatase MutT (NUDIX family)
MRLNTAIPQLFGKPSSEPSKNVDRVRCVLRHEQRYLLAQHNSRRPENRSRWGLAGGRVRGSEKPRACLRRELIEELGCRVPYLVELGDWRYRDETHRVYGCEIARTIDTFDRDELCAIAWFTYAEVVQLAAAGRLRTGFELPAIAEFEQQTASPRT